MSTIEMIARRLRQISVDILVDILAAGVANHHGEDWFASVASPHNYHYWAESMKRAVEIEYRVSELRYKTISYWNPTDKRVNVYSLGIRKEGEIVSFVEPGKSVEVPIGYTIGGKYSVISGIAPQLMPLPDPSVPECNLDLHPVFFEEWQVFGPRDIEGNLSSCCHRSLAWLDSANRVVCSKCFKPLRSLCAV